jgi:transposase
MIRSSKHRLSDSNFGKRQEIHSLVSNYRCLVQEIIDYIWINGYRKFCVSKNKLDCPSLVDSSFLKNFSWDYTERLKQAAGKQALMMLSAATEKRKKQLWKLKHLQKEGASTKYLQRAISHQPLVKPNASKINLELDSRFIDFDFTSNKNKFIGFVRLSSIKKGLTIKVPLIKTPVFDKWNVLGKRKQSIRLSEKNINLFFEIEELPKKEVGEIVGCDQGITEMLTLSDNQTVPKYQGRYSLSDVQNILARKKKGSKSFAKAQDFRKNIINWSINQLNFSNIKELRLEKLFQVGKGKSRSRFMSHWTYTLINDKLKRLSEEKGFLLKEVTNEFRSQRCSDCGWVRKANRKKKSFCCNKCGNELDADLNASYNLLLDLYEIPYWVRLKKINRKGFYWMPDGLFSDCHEPIVHDAETE